MVFFGRCDCTMLGFIRGVHLVRQGSKSNGRISTASGLWKWPGEEAHLSRRWWDGDAGGARGRCGGPRGFWTLQTRLAGIYDGHEITTVLGLGLLCSHPRPALRQVLIFNGNVDLPHVPLFKLRVAGDMQRRSAYDLSWTTNSSSYCITSDEI